MYKLLALFVFIFYNSILVRLSFKDISRDHVSSVALINVLFAIKSKTNAKNPDQ